MKRLFKSTTPFGAAAILPDASGSGRSRVRIPGGSGCDDPGDVLEHPECRL